jgi:FMN-dependent NADH-azoreductase
MQLVIYNNHMRKYYHRTPFAATTTSVAAKQIGGFMNLLQIDSSARASSESRKLTARFVQEWKLENPNGTVTERDLATTPLPHITDHWSATYGDPAKLTPEQRQYLATSDELIEELRAADTVVIGAPMYNHMISWELKAWIDQIMRVGKTIAFGPSGPKGLLDGKKAVVITARGGSYPAGSPRAAVDFQSPYLRHILTTLGFSGVTFIHAENLKGDQLESSRAGAAAAIRNAVVAHANTDSHELAVTLQY